MGISLPTFSQNGVGYKFLFEQESVQFVVDRVRDKNDSTSAEITVYSTEDTDPSFLHRTRMNLLSTTAKKQLSSQLETRVKQDDWGGLVEMVCHLSIEKHRQGEPVEAIGEPPTEPAEKDWLVYPLIQKGEANIIFGKGSDGKTYLACLLALLVQSGQDYAHFKLPNGGTQVMYLDFETERARIGRRLWWIANGLNSDKNIVITVDPSKIKYRRCTQAIYNDVENIQKEILHHNIGLAIIDSVGFACGGEPEKAEVVLRYFTALRTLGITTLSIDHVSKGGENGATPFGSVYKTNCARNSWEIRKHQEHGDDWFVMGMYNKKENDGPLMPPLAMKLNFYTHDTNGSVPHVLMHKDDIRDTPELMANQPQHAQIAAVLRKHHGLMHPDDIAEAISTEEKKVTAQNIRSTLSKHKDKFYAGMDGKYGIAAGGKYDN